MSKKIVLMLLIGIVSMALHAQITTSGMNGLVTGGGDWGYGTSRAFALGNHLRSHYQRGWTIQPPRYAYRRAVQSGGVVHRLQNNDV